MRRKQFALWAGLGLFLGWGAMAAAQDNGTALSIDSLRARCPSTRNLAPTAFASTGMPSASELDERQQRIRGGLRAVDPPANAEVVLRAFAGGSITQQEQTHTATVLWRLADGSWHVVVANYYPNRLVPPTPPPAPMPTAEQIEAARHSIGAGELDHAQATALNALLADPCLEAEPSVALGQLPLRAGPPTGPCFDGVAQTVEVVRAGRRRVYVQDCLRFLAGELIGIALYPRGRADSPQTQMSQTLASPESARHYADRALVASGGGEFWLNDTNGPGGYSYVHRLSGFRCAATAPGEIEVYPPVWEERAGPGGRCVRNNALPLRSGGMRTEWRVGRPGGGSEVERRVRRAADDWFSGYHGSETHRRILMRSVSFDGLRMSRAEVAGPPQVDGRDDELTVVLGAEHDGWILVARATGSVSDRAAVEAAALREWRRVVETRSAPPA